MAAGPHPRTHPMLTLQIRFESSWTNSFCDGPGGEHLFSSGSDLSKSAKGIIPADPGLLDEHSRHAYLVDLQAKNPGLLYRVPVDFNRTVQGVLARLVGEIRRLEDVEQDHLALRAFGGGDYTIDLEHEHSQTTRLSTSKTNDVLGGGAGIIRDEVQQLYSPNPKTRYLFGFLGLNLAQMQQRVTEVLDYEEGHPEFTWTPSTPAALIERLYQQLPEEQKVGMKAARQAAGQGSYVSPYLALCQQLQRVLPQEVQEQLRKNAESSTSGKPLPLDLASGALEGWGLAGALVVARIRRLSDEMRDDFFKAGVLNKNKAVAGLAMSGGVGRITPKDVYKYASGVPMESNRMPYSIDVPVVLRDGNKEKKGFVPSGVLKKTGTLKFHIRDDDALAQEVYDAIRAASVGPFHFGKKGVAYIEKLRLS